MRRPGRWAVFIARTSKVRRRAAFEQITRVVRRVPNTQPLLRPLEIALVFKRPCATSRLQAQLAVVTKRAGFYIQALLSLPEQLTHRGQDPFLFQFCFASENPLKPGLDVVR